MNDKNIKKSYWAVTPATVRYDNKLPQGAKLLYGEISALCNERGYCWASNKYFADLYDNDERTISRWITALAKQGHVYVKIKGKDRKIFLTEKIAFETDGLEEPEQDDQEDTPEEPAAKKKAAKKKAKVKPIEKKFSDNDMRLSELLLQKIIFNFPAFENKKVKLSEWAEEIRKLREIDKAQEQQIEFMITWVHGGQITMHYPDKPPREFKFEQHDFWARNIMSAKKLRKQWFDNLVPQLQEAFKKQVKKHAVADLSNKGQQSPVKTHRVGSL